eukprot:3690155-Prymnesium_polylepis.2
MPRSVFINEPYMHPHLPHTAHASCVFIKEPFMHPQANTYVAGTRKPFIPTRAASPVQGRLASANVQPLTEASRRSLAEAIHHGQALPAEHE